MDDARTGLWVDYARGNHLQILANGFWAQVLKSVVAVFLTLTGPYVFKILKSFVLWFQSWDDPPSSSEETQPLVNRPATLEGTVAPRDIEATANGAPSQPATEPSAPAPETPFQSLQKAHGGRETVANFIRNALQRGADFSAAHGLLMLMISTVILTVFVSQVVANQFSADIATNSAALSSSTTCGIWVFDESAGEEAMDRASLLDHKREARAGEYAGNCYSQQDIGIARSCNYFYNPNITFSTQSQDRCPFHSHAICSGGLYSAVLFDTGLVSANSIGVNTDIDYKFRRKTSCSPLSIDAPYVRNYSSKETDGPTFLYYYGQILNASDADSIITDYTYKTLGDPFEWLAPVYSVNTYSTSLYPELDYWRPIPELRPPEGSILAIFFVSSLHIYHQKPSSDPIFPATKPRYFEGFHDPYFFNSDPRARPFACVDTTELCSPDGSLCWSMTEDVPSGIPVTPAYWLMKWSLERSNTYDAIKWRLGTALLAQEKISQSFSLPLGDDHWEAEARRLFETSLATVQFEAWSIANGENRGLPGFVDVTPDEASSRLCGLYKFNSLGYTNIDLGAFLGLIGLSFGIWFLSLDARRVQNLLAYVSCRLIPADDSDYSDARWKPLVINKILGYIFSCLALLLNALFLTCVWIYRKVPH